jgi:hypothetical protein
MYQVEYGVQFDCLCVRKNEDYYKTYLDLDTERICFIWILR